MMNYFNTLKSFFITLLINIKHRPISFYVCTLENKQKKDKEYHLPYV